MTEHKLESEFDLTIFLSFNLRYAITVWYYEAEERARALKRFKGKLKVRPDLKVGVGVHIVKLKEMFLKNYHTGCGLRIWSTTIFPSFHVLC